MNRRYVDLRLLSCGSVCCSNQLMQMYRVTIRATQDTVPKVMLKMMEERLAKGISTDLS